MNFIDQYLKNGAINAPFDAMEYRLELQHRILRSSTNMIKACIICGTTTEGTWVQTEEERKNDTIHYFCIICVANTPKSELHALFKDDAEEGQLRTIPEEFIKPLNASLKSNNDDTQHTEDDNPQDNSFQSSNTSCK